VVASAEPPSFGALASAAIEWFLLVTTCVGRAGCSIAEGMVRSDRVIDDAESVDLHLEGVAVGDHAAEYVLVL
jgi:hypothetical protein